MLLKDHLLRSQRGPYQRIRVFLADDHKIMRDSIKQILADADDIEVVGETDNGDALLKEIDRFDIDLIIMDITMPGPPALEVVNQIATSRGSKPVLMLSVHSEEQYAARFIKAGAHGYLSKGRVADHLVAAIHKIREGGIFIAEDVRQAVVHSLPHGAI